MGFFKDLYDAFWIEARYRWIAAWHQPTKIVNLEPGPLVKIIGRVQLISEPLIAPHTNRRCAHLELEEGYWVGNTWAVRNRETRALDFAVVDETGRALVRTRNERPSEVLVAARSIQRFWDPDTKQHIAELVLEEGARVAVVGRAVRAIDDRQVGGGYRDAPTTVVVEAVLVKEWEPFMPTFPDAR
jgi:hypothetical protein